MSRNKLHKFDSKPYFDYLVHHIKKDAITLRDALIKHKAVIAGGSLIRIYAEVNDRLWSEYCSDLDIYVQQKDAMAFIKSINDCDISFNDRLAHTASAYCMSFFRKNKILSRITGKIGYCAFDLMIVDNDRAIKDVVTNFDLTFCEIWYDGKEVFSTENVTQQKGFLRAQYQDELFKHNNYFIKKRIRKYTARGFKIHIDKSAIDDITLAFTKRENDEKHIENPEEWVVKKVIDTLNESIYYHYDDIMPDIDNMVLFMCSFGRFTVAELEASMNKYIMSIIMTKHNLVTPVSMKSVCVVMLHELYMKLPTKYRLYIKEFLKIKRADIESIISAGSISEYLKLSASTEILETLPHITKEEYDTFVKNNKAGFDVIMNEEVPIKSFLKMKGNIVLVTPDNTGLCVDMDYVKTTYKDKANNWMYKCNGHIIAGTNDRSMVNIDKANPYVKMTISMNGMNGFIPAKHIEYMIRSKRKLFFIKPQYHIENGRSIHRSITHSVSYALTYRLPGASAVSANHCQHGSNIMIYDIYCYDARFVFPAEAEGSPAQSLSNSSTPVNRSNSKSSS